MDANVTFTEDFKKKTHKKLGNARKKELRIKSLIKAEKDGRLMGAKTRRDVAKLAGFTDAQGQSGYIWVWQRIKEGTIKEFIMNRAKDGHAEYEYHIVDKEEEPVILSRAFDPKKTVTLTNVHPKVTIRFRNFMVELEDMKLDEIAKLIKVLSKED